MKQDQMISRRDFMQLTGACAGACAVSMANPGLSFAGPGDATAKRLAIVYLSGGLDQLTFLPPYADPNYKAKRGPFAAPSPGETPPPNWGQTQYLNDMFGLYGMPHIYPLLQNGDMTIVHSSTVNWNCVQSHFLETELVQKQNFGPQSSMAPGFVNRLLTEIVGENSPGALSFYGDPNLPVILSGPEAVGSFQAPGQPIEATLLQKLRAAMGNGYLRQSFDGAINNQNNTALALAGHPINYNNWNFPTQAQTMALMLASDPVVAPIAGYTQVDGFDWHSFRTLDITAQLNNLSLGLRIMVDTLKSMPSQGGGANAFEDTLIVVFSEFGRSVVPNGPEPYIGGIDHGHAQAGMILTGNPMLRGAAGGSGLMGIWPGLSNTPGNMLTPTANFMDVVREYMRAHFGLTSEQIQRVIPHSGQGGGLGGA